MKDQVLKLLYVAPISKKSIQDSLGLDKMKLGILLPKLRTQELVESYETNHETGELTWALTDKGRQYVEASVGE